MTLPWIWTDGHSKKEKREDEESETFGFHGAEIGRFSTIHKWRGQQIKIIKFNADETFLKALLGFKGFTEGLHSLSSHHPESVYSASQFFG